MVVNGVYTCKDIGCQEAGLGYIPVKFVSHSGRALRVADHLQSLAQFQTHEKRHLHGTELAYAGRKSIAKEIWKPFSYNLSRLESDLEDGRRSNEPPGR